MCKQNFHKRENDAQTMFVYPFDAVNSGNFDAQHLAKLVTIKMETIMDNTMDNGHKSGKSVDVKNAYKQRNCLDLSSKKVS